MKIQQLPLGARFEFEGREYVKTATLFATGPDGKPRLIPKYAVLKPLGDFRAPPAAPKASFARDEVLRALDALVAECRALVPAERQGELEAARDRFMGTLDG